MNTYRAELRLRSALGTPLTADTLFGHLCWGLVYHEGADRLRAFLTDMDSPQPPLVISDPLPTGCWPMPALPGPPISVLDRIRQEHKLDLCKGYDRIRRAMKQSFIPHEIWDALAARLDTTALAERLVTRPPTAEPLTRVTVPHNTINRLTVHTGSDAEAGGLFFEDVWFPNSKNGAVTFDLWILSVYPPERIKNLFTQALAGGYGRDAGTGKGHLTVEFVEPAELPRVDQPNAVMTLGTCIPAEQDPTEGFWNAEVRHGKLGGAWATGGETDAVFKYPVVLLARGAVFCTDQPRPILGRMVHQVHPTRPEVVTCGYTLTLPVHLSEEALPCHATA